MTPPSRFAFGRLAPLASTLLLLLALAWRAGAQPSYYNFESGQVRPLALSPDGTRLFALDTPDGHLEIFDLTGALPTHVASVPVGLEPVAVAALSNEQVWVVNHLSDSVSIVDVGAAVPHVVRTLLVGDEPTDIVFGGPSKSRAFIATAHRGQASPYPTGEYDLEGIGRADVWVFDTASPGSTVGGTPITVLTLFGDRPRALAVSPDGSQVYAAVFLSGNGTTALGEGAVCDGGSSVGPCSVGGTVMPGGLPEPNENHAGVVGPETGLIVRQTGATGPWLDELGRDWSPAVRFELPDLDVFAIDATATPPVAVGAHAGVGTVLFGMEVNPATGSLYVTNTEARNHVRFEGPGLYVTENALKPSGEPASVRGHLHEARITVIGAGGAVAPVHLNPHIPYAVAPTPAGTRDRSLATPVGLAITADGATVYVAALGSSAVGVLDAASLEAGTVDTSVDRLIELGDPGPVGPTGLVLDEARGRLYVLTRFDDSVVTIDLATEAVLDRRRLHTPEPAAVIQGRPMLYDAYFTSSNGEASCASCHVFGDLDALAWDLGDPDGEVALNPNPNGPGGGSQPFHPLKGPMTTQSLRGMADQGPMHWRGDRTGGSAGSTGDPLDERAAFLEFDVAFEGLLGRDEGPLRDEELERFADFALSLTYPPNPLRQLDNALRADEAAGETLYHGVQADPLATCEGCHALDRSQGFFGGEGATTEEAEPQQFEVPHLRSAYQKVGMFGMPAVPFFAPGDNGATGPQVRGFGFLHDGSVDTLVRFFRAGVFSGLSSDTQRRQLEAFVMVFDSLLAPIVGQQVTLRSDSGADASDRVDLMIARAEASTTLPGGATTSECELVAKGVVSGEARGWLYDGAGSFHSDRQGESIATAALLALAATPGSELTFTCAPPGAGARMAYDRDEDGVRDSDERDDGTDPASRPFVAIPDPTLPVLPPPPPDAGLGDGGPTTDPGGGGCGCAVPGQAPAGGGPGGLLLLLVAAGAMQASRARRAATARTRAALGARRSKARGEEVGG